MVNQICRKKVTILASGDLSSPELSCALKLFAIRRPTINDWYSTDILFPPSPWILTEESSFLSEKDTVFDYTTDADMLVIPSWYGVDFVPAAELLVILQQLHQQGCRLVSFGSGLFVLASSGLLNGMQVACSHRDRQLLSEKFPEVDFVDNIIFTNELNLSCSAEGDAALKLGLHLICNDFGSSVAAQVKQDLQTECGCNAEKAALKLDRNALKIRKVVAWASKNLEEVTSVEQLVDRAYMSRRSFDRKFSEIIGISAKKWLTQARLKLAQDFLENSELTIEEIAGASGFETGANFRNCFSTYMETSPSEYRRKLQF